MNHYWSYSKDVAGERYKELLQYLLEHSDAFQVVISHNRVRSKPPAGSKRFLEAPRSDKIGGWSKTGDYELPLTEGTTSPGKYCTTAMFQVSKNSYHALETPSSFFSWYLPQYPEDLSFYRDGTCWFALCSQEKLLWFCGSKDDAKRIEELFGIPFERGESCTECDLYHEAYTLRKVITED